MTTQRTITLPADQWEAILEAVECHCDEGPPRLSAASAALSSALEQPEPEGPTDEELWKFWDEVDGSIPTIFRTALARWGRPTPQPVSVSVSERLPGPEDCDAEGRCWWGRPSDELCNSDWFLATRAEVDEFCDAWPPIVWAPHWALPVPIKAS